MNERIQAALQNEEMELDLGALFWSILSKWRLLLVCALILALLLGGYGAFSTYRNMMDPEYMQDCQLNEQYSQFKYETAKDLLENRITEIERELVREKEYQENSNLFAIDPYNTYVSTLFYFVNTEYEIIPELYYQNPDNTTVVTEAYCNAARSVNVGQVLRSLGLAVTESEKEYDKASDFIQTDMQSNGNFKVRIIGGSQEEANAVSDAVKAELEAQEASIRDAMGDHTLTLLLEKKEMIVESNLVELHNAYEERAGNLTESLEEALSEYNKLEEPKSKLPTERSIWINGIKYAIIGAVAALILGGVVLLFDTLFKARIATPDDVSRRYGAPILGVLPAEKKRGKLDCAIAKHLGVPGNVSGEGELSYVLANLDRVADGVKSLVLAGTCGKEELSRLSAMLREKRPELRVCAGGDICMDADAVLAFNESDAVVFVERLQRSRYADVRRELATAVGAGKKCLGFILFEKDR